MTNMQIKQAEQLIKDNIIVKHYAGSIAYGTNISTSDTDFRGIFVAAPVNIRTPFFRINEAKDTTEEDTVIYELSQFMKLALECNPNVIESLWIDESDITFTTDAYQLLRSYAPQFLCSRIAYTTSGYALAQLKRIKGHNKWITNVQPELPPRQSDFMTLVHNFTGSKIFKISLTENSINHRLVPYSGNTFGVYQMDGYSLFNEETGNLNTEYAGDSHSLGAPLYIVKFNKDEYNNANDTWANYWRWKKNRNVARSELEEHYGYDTKHAMHLVRLLRMGEEALTTGQIIVKRPDAKELLEIRDGAWTYDDLVAYAEEKDNYIHNVLYKQTLLPKNPDYKLAAQVMMDVQDLIWSRHE
jgi:predicted nucleotidyltransferase